MTGISIHHGESQATGSHLVGRKSLMPVEAWQVASDKWADVVSSNRFTPRLPQCQDVKKRVIARRTEGTPKLTRRVTASEAKQSLSVDRDPSLRSGHAFGVDCFGRCVGLAMTEGLNSWHCRLPLVARGFGNRLS